MKLTHRYLVTCEVTIAPPGCPPSKGMRTTVAFALPDVRPATIAEALDDYCRQCWSKDLSEVTILHSSRVGGELWDARPES